MQHEEFDRSRCFTFFKDYHEQIMLVKTEYGIDKAFEVYEAIVNYGLYGTEITDSKLKMMMGTSTITSIENSQSKRAKCFAGEDLELSRSIILLHRDRPELSQNQIVKILKTSKGKVNKTLQKYRNGEYEGIIDFDDNSSSNSYSNAYASSNAYSYTTVDRDRTVTGSGNTESTDVAVTDGASAPNKQPIELTTEIIDLVYVLFQTGTKYDEISVKTGLNNKQIFEIIEDGKLNNFIPPEERSKIIPLSDGVLSQYTTDDFIIDENDKDNMFIILTDENGDYSFHKDFVKEWFYGKAINK